MFSQSPPLFIAELRGVRVEISTGLTCVTYAHPLVTLPSTVEVKGGT